MFFSGYVVYLTIVLFPLGLYYALRWNLSYAFLVATLVCLLASLPSRPFRITVCVVLAAFSMAYTFNNFIRQFTTATLFTSGRVWYWNPIVQPTGAEQIARIIDREERRAKAPGRGLDVALLIQEHGGLQDGALNYNFKVIGSSLTSRAVGYGNNAVNVDFLTGSRYVVLPRVLRSARDHPEANRNEAVAQRWLPRHPDAFVLVGTADSRFGLLDVYKRLVPAVSPAVEEDLIRIGSDLESGTAFESFWKLARFRLAASTNRLTPELERELDMVAAQAQSLRNQLEPPVFARLENEIREARTLPQAMAGSSGQPLVEPVGSGGVEGFVDDARRVSQCMLVRGWALRADHTGPVRSVLIVQNGTILAEADAFDERPDVARYFKNPALSRSGFTLCVPLDSLRAGADRVDLVARDSSGTLHRFADAMVR